MREGHFHAHVRPELKGKGGDHAQYIAREGRFKAEKYGEIVGRGHDFPINVPTYVARRRSPRAIPTFLSWLRKHSHKEPETGEVLGIGWAVSGESYPDDQSID